MHITYQFSQRDFLDAVSTGRKYNAMLRWFRYIAFLFFIFTVITFALTVWGIVLRRTPIVFSDVVVQLAFIVMWVGILWGLPRYEAGKQFRQQPAVQGERQLNIGPEGLVTVTPVSRSETSWKTFIRWGESKTVFLLFTSPACFSIIPKRAFTPEQLIEFRAMLQQHIGNK